MNDPPALIPEVVDEDVEWVCRIMGLREFDQPRLEFLRARSTLDISACPGSGKTTLIVAKLAIIARKWPHRTKGICVLSHTNAAREEIQRCLRGTVVGQQLLSYPHFIDTIHSFVNRFLALPWLNSNGFPSATVDDEVTSAYRRRSLTKAEYWKVENFLLRRQSGFDRIRLKDRNCQIGLSDGPFPAKSCAETHMIARRAVQASSAAGYFCYDEMFVWAEALLEDCPAVSTFLQCRFPLAIIDEMQDTSELQVGILDAVFPRSGSEVVLQRVGDPNQAIYDDEATFAVTSAAFPNSVACLTIPNSFRFGPSIAALASPFAIEAVGPEGLQGIGPRVVGNAPALCSNAVFIFPDAYPEGVLNVYGEHVLSSFSDECLDKGVVAAVGAVHRDATDVVAGNAKFPKTVPHYWNCYTAEIARREPHPRTLVKYVRVAQSLVRDGHELSPGVEKIASGLVRLARRSGSSALLGRRAPRHRALVEALASNPQAAAAYGRLLRAFLIDLETQTPDSWRKRKADIQLVAMGLTDSGIAPDPGDDFLRWDEQYPSLTASARSSPSDAGSNVYRVFGCTGRFVDIHLGSIHSVRARPTWRHCF